MKLFLMRHGEASWDAASDYDRRLTERGGQQVLAQAEKLVREMQAINRVFTSPIVRARQTCDLYLDAIAYQGTVSQVDWLRHETSAGKAIEALYTTLGNDFQGEVILFSHQPLASQFVAAMCGVEAVEVPMQIASIAAMNCSHVVAGMAELLWLEHSGD